MRLVSPVRLPRPAGRARRPRARWSRPAVASRRRRPVLGPSPTPRGIAVSAVAPSAAGSSRVPRRPERAGAGPPRPGGGARRRWRSSRTASTRRCGSSASPTAAAGSSVAEQGGTDPDRQGRPAAPRPVPRHHRPDSRRAASAACSASRSRPASATSTRRCSSTTRTSRRHHDRRLRRARPARPRSTRGERPHPVTPTSRTPTTTAAWIGFDRTGMLLIALGDGGSGGDPREPRPRTWASSWARSCGSTSSARGDRPYAIPPDNPFVDRAGARPEVLHYGLRNPFRDSIDPATGDLWIGDVGPGRVGGDRRRAGRRAAASTSAGVAGRAATATTRRRAATRPASRCPSPSTRTTLGCAIIGGVVYHGDAIPALRGAYLFSDNCSGTLWAIDAGLEAPQAPITLLETGRSISSFGVDDARRGGADRPGRRAGEAGARLVLSRGLPDARTRAAPASRVQAQDRFR